MKKRRIIALSVLILLISIFCIMTYYIGLQVFNGSTQLVTNETTSGERKGFWKEYGIDYEQFCNTYKIEKVEIESSFDGHMIPADYIYAIDANENRDFKTVILVHGLGGNRYSTYPIAEFFLQNGYNVIAYDQRSSGENTAQYTTFGYWEKYDLIDYVNYVKEQAPNQKIGIWGTSFGGATAGQAVGYKDICKKVDFLILDCPVGSMKWMIEDQIKDMDIGIPIPYMIWCGSIVNNMKLGFTYSQADTAKSLRKVSTPVLIINSKKDTMTPYFMGKEIYDSIENNSKEIWTVDDSEHTDIWLEHNEEYKNKVLQFIQQKTQ